MKHLRDLKDLSRQVEGGKVLVDLPPDLSTYAQTRAYIGYQV